MSGYSISRQSDEVIAGLKTRVRRLEGELADVRSDARAMDGQLTALGEALRREADRWARLHSADPTDPIREARAAQASEARATYQDTTGRTP